MRPDAAAEGPAAVGRSSLPNDKLRARRSRKAAEADRAVFIAAVGRVGWQRELERRAAERNARTRERVRAVVAAKRAGHQGALFEEGP